MANEEQLEFETLEVAKKVIPENKPISPIQAFIAEHLERPIYIPEKLPQSHVDLCDCDFGCQQ